MKKLILAILSLVFAAMALIEEFRGDYKKAILFMCWAIFLRI